MFRDASQSWVLSPQVCNNDGWTYALIDSNSEMCLDVERFTQDDGGEVRQKHCTFADNQLWKLRNVGPGDVYGTYWPN